MVFTFEEILKNQNSRCNYKKQSTVCDETLTSLWFCDDEKDWENALNYYWDMLRINQIEIEKYMNTINADYIRDLSTEEFYDFLHDKYFVWKYTQKNRLSRLLSILERYKENNEMHKLESIHQRLFTTPKGDIEKCLEVATEIAGLGTAGASGLLSILFPEYFSTVDQFVVKRLREVDEPNYKYRLAAMNPESLKSQDGVLLIQIMRDKAAELNKKFNTDFWTPRKIDMVLWAYGR